MYGDCQTTKFHYMVQCYYVPEHLPSSMWVDNYHYNCNNATSRLFPYKKFTGKWRTWSAHKIDNEYSEAEYLNGVLNGKKTIWHENGVKSYEAFYKDGQQIGWELSWYESGKKQSETNYGNGLEQKKYTSYYESGKIKKITEFIEGKRIQSTEWYENGNKKSFRTFKNDEIYIRECWNEDGTYHSF